MAFDRKQTIFDSLMAKKKVYLDDLRRLLDFDVKASLKKEDLARALAEELRFEGEYWIPKFPEREIQIIEALISHPKGKPLEWGAQSCSSLLEIFGLIDAEYDERGDVTFRVTDEMYDAFKCGIKNAAAARVCMRYSEYERYLQGMLNIYGVVPYQKVFDMIIEAAKKIEDEDSPLDIHRNPLCFLDDCLLMQFYTIEYDGVTYVHHPTIMNAAEALKEQQMRKPQLITYKDCSLEEFYAAGEYADFAYAGAGTEQCRELDSQLEKMGFPEEHREMVKYLIWRLAQEPGGTGIGRVMEMVGNGFGSMQELNTFMKAVMEFHNAVPKWSLMGRTSYEVSGNRGKTTVAKMPIKKNKFKS